MLELKDGYVLIWWRKEISGKEKGLNEQRNKSGMLSEVGQFGSSQTLMKTFSGQIIGKNY